MSQSDMNFQFESPKRPSNSSSKNKPADKTNTDLNVQDVQFEDLDQLWEFEDGIHFKDDKTLEDIQLDHLEHINTSFEISLFKN